MAGSQGGTSPSSQGGKGGRVQATLAVTAGQILNIYAGGAGANYPATCIASSGGFNGGGNGYGNYAGAGGGASDIRVGGTALSNRVLVAAGGGGAGYNCGTANGEYGGDGGGTTGSTGAQCGTVSAVYCGSGGTQLAGGVGATSYPVENGGALGQGGSAATNYCYSGGGGGGYYGGGSGAYGGGGGGSSFIAGTGVSGATTTASYQTGAGYVTISYTVPTPVLCIGSTETLTDGTSGGTWSSSNPAVASIGSSTGLVTGLSGGTTTISYLAASGLCAATKSITINGTSVSISGTLQVCTGQTTTLTGLPSGGTWTCSNLNASIGFSSGIVTGVTAGNSVITYTAGSGCIASSTVTVNNTPSAIYGYVATSGSGSTTLNYTGAVQTYTVPNGSSSVAVDMAGSQGGTSPSSQGGKGGRVQATLAVTAGQILNVYVGGTGTNYPATCIASAGGFNGGGNGYGNYAGGGGGASDIRVGGAVLSNRVLVAAGGGGAGYNCGTVNGEYGGDGGGTTGNTGAQCGTVSAIYCGSGGTQLAGGVGATSYPVENGGALGQGGNAATNYCYSGGGGGGYYGGGSGAYGGGGGGSSYFSGTGVSGASTTASYRTGSGYVTISYTTTATPLCVGSTVTLTNATSGGTWTSSNPAVANVGSSTGIMTGVAGGSVTITYTSGSCISTIPVTVNSSVVSITGTTLVCTGQTSTLTGSPSGGTWTSSSANATVGSSSGVVNGVTAGTAVITYQPGGSCAVTTTVTVSPPASISSYTLTPTLQNICQGGTINLGVNITGGAGTPTYTWTGPGITTLNTTSVPTFSYTTNTTGTGTYTVSLSFSGAACISPAPLSTPLTYTVAPQPSVSAYIATPLLQNLCQGGDINLGVTSTGGSGTPTFTWTGPGITTLNTTSVPSIAYTSNTTGNGNYNVTLTYSGTGCNTSSALATALAYTVAAQPSVASYTLTPTSQNICQGGTINLGVSSTGGSGTATYTWTGPGITTSNTTPVPNIGYTSSTTGNGNYNVTLAYSGIGCIATLPLATPLTYTVAPQPVLTSYLVTPPSQNICQGGVISLGVSGSGGIGIPTYTWTGPGITTSNTTGVPSITYTTSATGNGNYNVTVGYSGIGCNTTAPLATPFTYTVAPQPSLTSYTLTPTTQNICQGGVINLGVTSSGGAGTPSYTWSGPGITSTASTSVPALSYTSAVTGNSNYSVTLTYTGTGCNTTGPLVTPLTYTVAPQPTVTSYSLTPTSQNICQGGVIILGVTSAGGSGTATYSWTGPGITTSNTTSVSAISYASATTGNGNYNVTLAYSGIGCNTTAPLATPLTYTVTPQPSLSTYTVTPTSQNICQGGVVNLGVSSSGGIGIPTYTWTGPGITTSNITGLPSLTYTTTATGNGNYNVTLVYDGIGCNTTAPLATPLTYTVAPQPSVSSYSLTPTSQNICQGGVINLGVNCAGGAGTATYIWTGPGITTSNTSSVANIGYTSATTGNGNYNVTLAYSGTGCNTTAPLATPFTYTVAPQPSLSTYTLTPTSQNICQGGVINLGVSSSGGIGNPTYSWSGPGITSSTTTVPANLTYTTATTGNGNYNVTLVYDGLGCITTAPLVTPLTYTVAPQPSVSSYTLTPTSQNICQGGVINLGISSAGGIGSPTYTWSGPGITTSGTSSIPNLTYTTAATGNGNYNVTLAYTGIGCNTTAPLATPLTYTVAPQPSVSSYTLTPTSQNICQGGTINLGVTSSGGIGTATYTWTGPGIATSNTTSVPNIGYTSATTGSGNYNVTLTYSGTGCNATAPLATPLTYTVAPQPSISSYTLTPTSQNICQGGVINLGVSTSGGIGTPTYTWTGPGITVSNTTSASNITYTTAATGNGNYTVSVGYTGIGCNTSAPLATPLTYTVAPQPSVSSYSLIPTSQNICQGGVINLGVNSAGGSGTATYTWTGPGITTSNTTSIPSIGYISATTGNGNYNVTLAYSGTGCNTTAPLATLLTYTVAPQPSVSSYTLTPTSQNICQGGVIMLGVGTSGGIGTPIYTWSGPGITTSNTTGVPSISYTTAITGNGNYSVTLGYTGIGCNTTVPLATPLTYTVAPQPSVSSYTLTPTSQNICQGGVINLGVSSAGGIGSPTYTWSGPGITTSGTSSIPNLTYTTAATGNGNYNVTLAYTGIGCNTTAPLATSLTYTVAPQPGLSAYTLTPTSQNICQGGTINLGVSSSGGIGTATYTWTGPGITTLNTTSVPGIGYTSATTGSGNYNVTLAYSGTGCNTTAPLATPLTYTVAPQPSISSYTLTPTSQNICQGGVINLGVSTSGGIGTPTYTWTGPGITVSNTTSAANITYTTAATGNGNYTVSVAYTGIGCNTSAPLATPLTYTVAPQPSVSSYSLIPTSQNICQGGVINLGVNSAGGAGTATYTWTGPGITTANTTSIPSIGYISATTGNGNYNVTLAYSGTGCNTTAPMATLLTYTVAPQPTVSSYTLTPTLQNICQGGVINLGVSSSGGIGAPTYTWSGPGITTSDTTGVPSISYTTTTTGNGNYTVTLGYTGIGCNTTAPIATPLTYTVAPQPSIALYTTIPPTQNICLGGTINLGVSNTGGSGTPTYTWTGPGITTSNTTTVASIAYTSATTGNGNYDVTLAYSGTGCNTTAPLATVLTYTLNPLPTAAPSSSTPICNGGTVSLYANPGGSPNMYAWSGSNLSSTTVQNPTATPTVTSTYSLTVSYGTGNPGCNPATVYTTTVTVNGAPTLTNASNNGPICSGTSLNLAANGPVNVTTFSWVGPVVVSSSTSQYASIPSPTTTATGAYTVTVTDGPGSACTASYTTSAVVYALPDVSNFTPPSATAPCLGNSSTVTVNSTSMGAGTYIVTYNLSAPNAATSLTATLTMGASNGTFLVPSTALTHSGATTVTISSVTNAVGCSSFLSASNTATISVNPLPDITNFTSPTATTTCLGFNSVVTVYSTSLGTGTFNVTYNLSAPNAATGLTATLAMGATNGTFTIPASALTATGSTDVTITSITNVTPCNIPVLTSNVATFTVNPLPSAISGPAALCVGTTLTYTDATPGGTWLSNAPAMASVGSVSGSVAALAVGLPVITYTSPLGCYVTQSVSINPAPGTILGSNNVCLGSTTTLTVSSGTGTWSSNAPSIASIGSSTGIMGGVSAGSATITFTSGVACFITAPVTVNPRPVPSYTAIPASTICSSTGATYTTQSGGGISNYAWSVPGTLGTDYTISSGGTGTGNSTVTLLWLSGPSETVTVNYSDINGCTGVSPATNTTNINLRPIPYFSAAPPAGLCSGSNVGFVTQTGGGIHNYVWSVSGTYSIVSGGLTSTSYSVALSWSTLGSQLVTVNYTDINGCTGLNAATSTININPLPLAIVGTMNVCPGATTSISDSTAGGTWSSGTPSMATIGSTTGIITGVTAGTTTMSYTITSTGCSVVTPFTINPLPATISAIAFLCPGATSTFTDASPGGTWSSVTPSIATVGSSTGLVTAGTPGTDDIFYTLPTGCFTSSTLVVNTAPAAISGTFTLCSGTSTTFTDATPPGSWSSSNPPVATVDSITGLVNAISSGTATISYTLGTGCIQTQVITVNSTPVVAPVSGIPTVCMGQSTTLTDASPSGTWSSSNPSVATVTGGVVTSAGVGTTVIAYTAGSGGCSGTAVQTVTVNPIPSAISGNTPLCVGANITLTNAGGGSWGSGTTIVAGIVATTGVVSGAGPGNSTITYTLPVTGCTITAVVTVNALPSVSPIGGLTNICTGQTTTLTESTGSGIWSSSNTTVATIGTGGMVTGVGSGTTAISYSVTSGAGCNTTVTYGFTVNPLPAAIAGTMAICSGGITGLSDITPGGTWSSTPGAVGTIGATTGIFMGTGPGSATVSYTLFTGCSANSVVTVNTIPSAITGTLNVCAGLTTALGAIPGGGTWSSSNPGQGSVNSSGVVTGIAAGTPTITYTMGAGCYNTQQITINPLPPAISGVASACAGSASMLTDAGGGSWTSGTTSVAGIGSATGLVTASTAGNTTITYTLPTGCLNRTVFTVNPMPSPISGVASACIGNSSTLTSSPAGGTWSSSNTSIATMPGSAGTVTGVAAGTPTISYVLSAGCYITAPFTVNPLPSSILGTTSVCSGLTTTLSDFGGGSWSTSSTATAPVGATTGIVTGGTPGTATITYTLPLTGCATNVTVTVNTLPSAITGTMTVCAGLTTTLSATPSGGSWSSSSSTIASVSGGMVTGLTAGTATITYSLGSGCIATTVVTVNPVPDPIGGTMNVCAGLTSLLSDPSSGCTWSSSSPANAPISVTGLVTGNTAGTYTISYTLSSTGCLTTTQFTVNVNPASFTGGNVCVGNSITLSSSPTGGLWSSSNPTEGSVSTTGVVAGLAPGTPVITYAFSTGCFTNATVTINALPGTITGSTVLCAGTSGTFVSSPSGGTWTSSNTTVATIGSATGLINGLTPGNSTITYALPAGCQITTVITVNTNPASLSGTMFACVGQSSALGSSPGSGTWTSSNTGEATVGATTGSVTGVSAGTPVITYTLSTGCYITGVFTVNPNPAAITGASMVCTGQTAYVSDATPGGIWYSSSTTTAAIGTGTGVITGGTPGTATITYTLSTGCNTTWPFTVNTLPSSITGGGAICPGNTLSLSDLPSGGTWSSSNTGEAIVNTMGLVTGVSTGMPTITYMLTAGCYATTTVTVNAIPDISSFTSPTATSQCLGGSSTVTVNSTSLGTATFIMGWTLSGANSGSGTPSVSMISGTGTFAIPSALLTNAGTTIVTINTITNSLGCGVALTGSNVATFAVNPLPGSYSVTGGGSYCAGGTGMHLFLSGSSTGISYQLYLGGTATGAPVAGTSSPIDFGVFTTAGTYTVVATNTSTGCVNNMSGGAIITINSLPTAQTVTGGGSYCAGGSGVTIGLSGSQSGVNYQLYNGSTAVGSPVAGSGTSISFGLQTAAGTYTVIATNATTTCTNGMTGPVSISVNPLPSAITGTTSICVGQSTSLGSTPSGGTWASSASAIAGAGSLTGLISGGTSGTATITYTLSTGCSIVTPFTVNALPSAISGPSAVCVGNTITLTSLPTGGTWSSSDIALATVSGGTVNGASAGSITISYVLSTGCHVSAPVTVNPLPAAITGPSAICNSYCVGYTDLTPGGTWSSSAVAVGTIGSATGTLCGLSTGTTNVIYTLTATGCLLSTPVSVNPNPGAISGTLSGCVGGGNTLSCSPAGGTWSSSNPAIASIGTSGAVTAVAAGVSQITYTLPAGCIATANYTVNALPAGITGTNVICQGLTTTLADATPGGNWTATGTASVGSATGIVTGSSAGTASITYTITSGCKSTYPVTVNPLPAAITGTANVCVGLTTTLNTTSTGGSWSSSNPAEATITSGLVTGISAGTPTITYTLPTGCLITTPVTVNPLPLGITGITTVCTGQTITLTDALPGGTWSSSATSVANVGSSGTVSGAGAGTATISYILSTGCAASTTVTVNQTPVTITGSPSICIGTSTSLTDATPGGIWASSNTALATIGSSTGIVNGIAAGNPVISYTMSTGCYTTLTASVNAPPSLITGTLTVCQGATTTLSDSTSGGLWTSGSTGIAGVSAGVVTGVTPGTATITYTLTTSCFATAVVTVNPLPAAVSGSSNVCIGSVITVNDITPGGTWSSSNTTLATVGLTSGIVTGIATGTPSIVYTLPTTCLAAFTISVNPLPSAISGTAVLCAGSASTLTDATPSGSWSSSNPLIGAISSSTGLMTGVSAGTVIYSYTLPTGCYTTVSGLVNALPNLFTITGGGSYCTGGTGVHTGLSGSNTGISYQLYNGSTAVGSAISGTGFSLDFGLITAGGTYTVKATNTTTGCNQTMSGTVSISGLSLPAAFTVSGGGSYCAGSAGLHVYLSGSASGISYQLFRGSTPVSSLLGTGSSLDFGAQTVAGTYTVVATNLSTTCTNTMAGSATISVNPLPLVYSVTGGGSYCSGGAGLHIGLSGSQSTGASYQLYNAGSIVSGALLSGTGSALDFGVFTITGTYTIVATATTTCSVNMSGSTTVTVNPLPGLFTVTSSGSLSYCIGSTAPHIGLSGSASGISYQLYNGLVAYGTPVSGTGAILDFGSVISSGTFTVNATNTITGCTNIMTSSISVTVNPLPTVFAITGGGSLCAGGAGVSVGLSGSQSGATYTLMNGTTTMATFTGTGSSFSFGTFSAAGTYTVTASASGCSATMSGSAAITVNALPTLFTVTGGGGYCESGSGTYVGLSGSQSGISYQLYRAGTAVGSPVSGTGTSINFGLQSLAGAYTVAATNITTTCSASVTGSVTVVINPLPLPFTVTGGGSYCSGLTGDSIGLSNSQSGVSYQLYAGSLPTGSAVNGTTGSSISFGSFTTAGTYTVLASNISTGCTNTMTGSVSISIISLPAVYSVSGGGEFCSGAAGVHVGLGGSQTGVNYQLYNGTTPAGSLTAGTGSSIDFGIMTAAGTYTVIAANTTTGCSNLMSGTAVIIINPLPAAYSVTGGGGYCSGGSGVLVGLSGSSTSINYQLYNSGTAVGGPVSGTGGALDFGLQTASGTYTVTATNTTTGCSATMTGSVSISVSALPTAFTVTGGGSICAGSAGVAVGLSGSQTGVNYQLYNGYAAAGAAVAGTGSALSFGLQNTAGIYTVVATSTSLCVNTMTGSVTITVNPLPVAYNITGGGSFCSGGSGLPIGLDGSDAGVNYQLYNSSLPVAGALVTGTGAAISFWAITVAGTYSVVASNTTTSCSSAMTGTVPITVTALPTLFTVTGGGSYCSGGSGVHIGLAGSTPGISYQLYFGTTAEMAPVTGTSSALDFGLQTGAGTYTVIATDPATGCVSTMTGSVTITINPLPGLYTVTGGGSLCSGGAGVHIGLSGSATGVSYQLYYGVTATGSPLSGSGSALDFGVFSAAGTYTVIAKYTATTCSRNMSGSATITVNPLPYAYTVTGGGGYCPGGSGYHVGLTGSTSGIHYQLYRGTTAVGSYLTGSGGSLDFGLQSVAGIYTVAATNASTSCIATMTGSATITVYTAPAGYSLTGGGSYCSGSGGIHVGLSGSDPGVSYQLYIGTSVTGSPVSGSGLSLDFGLETTAGTYTVTATNSTTGCTAAMTGSVSVTVSALPAVYTVTGGGTSCGGGTPFTIGLTGSQVGVTYILSRSGTAVASLPGTGIALSFGSFTTLGTYTVSGTNTATSCTNAMTGSAVIGLAAAITAYTVTGGGTYCSGGAGFHIYLSGSTSGINYQLYRGTSAVGSAVPGSGSALDFGVQTIAGGYNVQAVNPATGCSLAMTGSATIAVNPLPAAYTVTGGGSYCSGGFGLHVGLSSSDVSIHYQLYRGSTMVGSYLTGGGSTLDFGLQSSAGTYTVVSTNPSSACTNNMTGSVAITILSLPSAGVISGPSSVHTGATITLTETVSGGVWTSASGHITIGSSTGIATGVSAGGTTIIYTVTNICGSSTATYPVSETGTGARSYPAGTTEICLGTSETLPASEPGGVWSSSNDIIARVDGLTGLVTGVSVGTTSITYIVSDLTGGSNTIIIPVIIAPVPDALIIKADPGTAIVPGQKLSLTASVNNNSPVRAYLWSVNNAVIEGARTATYSSTKLAGNDVVNCTITGQCNSTQLSASVKVSVNTATIQQLPSTSDIRVIPNPNNGLFTISGSLGTTSDELVSIDVTDVLGQVIYKGKFIAKGGALNENIQLAGAVANGMYLLNLNSTGISKVIHIVVEQ